MNPLDGYYLCHTDKRWPPGPLISRWGNLLILLKLQINLLGWCTVAGAKVISYTGRIHSCCSKQQTDDQNPSHVSLPYAASNWPHSQRRPVDVTKMFCVCKYMLASTLCQCVSLKHFKSASYATDIITVMERFISAVSVMCSVLTQVNK